MCTLIRCLGFMGNHFLNCLAGCFSMIVWTPAVLSLLYACILYFCICTCSAQLSMFHMERRSRNTLITITIIIIIITYGRCPLLAKSVHMSAPSHHCMLLNNFYTSRQDIKTFFYPSSCLHFLQPALTFRTCCLPNPTSNVVLLLVLSVAHKINKIFSQKSLHHQP